MHQNVYSLFDFRKADKDLLDQLTLDMVSSTKLVGIVHPAIKKIIWWDPAGSGRFRPVGRPYALPGVPGGALASPARLALIPFFSRLITLIPG